MSKFKRFLLETGVYGGIGQGFGNTGKANLGGPLNLPNIFAYQPRTPITGWDSFGQMASMKAQQRAFTDRFPDPRLQDFTYGQVEQGLGALAQKVTDWFGILRAAAGGDPRAMQTKNDIHNIAINNAFMSNDNNTMHIVNGRGFYGIYGGNNPELQVGERLGILTKSSQNPAQGHGDFYDIHISLLRDEINKIGPQIMQWRRGFEGKQILAGGIDSIMQRMAQSHGGVQMGPNLNPFQH